MDFTNDTLRTQAIKLMPTYILIAYSPVAYIFIYVYFHR